MINMRQTFGRTLTEIAKEDKNVVVIVADISHGVFSEYRETIGERYYNIGICEPAIVSLAAGLSKVGLNPVVHTIAPFLIERSYEQIKLDFGYQNLNVNLVSVGSSFDYSKLGCSHHCYEEVAILKHFKRSQIFLPGSNNEFEILFKQHYKDNKINYYRITEYPHDEKINLDINKKEYSFKIKDGKDLTLVALGNQLKNAIKSEEILRNQGFEVEIIYFNALAPFIDEVFLESIKKTKKFICVEELSASGGLYEECLKTALKVDSKIIADQISITDFIHDYGSYEQLSEIAGLSVENITNQAKKLLI
jgi:transketolase